MPRVNSPCFNCEDRFADCHSSCTKYKDYKDKMSELNDLKKKDQNQKKDYFAYVGSKIFKHKMKRKVNKNDMSSLLWKNNGD